MADGTILRAFGLLPFSTPFHELESPEDEQNLEPNRVYREEVDRHELLAVIIQECHEGHRQCR